MKTSYTYVLHEILSFDDMNIYVNQWFKGNEYPMTWCILGNEQYSKDIFNEYIEKGWKFLFCFRKQPLNDEYDYIAVRKQGNNIYHTLTPNSCPDKPGIPDYLKHYKQYILNF